MQLKFSTKLFWLFLMAGTTVSGRFHCDACGKRQTTSLRRVNNAIIQVHCKVRFTLGKQEIPARPNSIDVRVGDKLKVVQFHPVILRCYLDSQYVTNHALSVREGVTTQSRAKSPGAPLTSTLSLCFIEQFNAMLGTVPRHSIRYPC